MLIYDAYDWKEQNFYSNTCRHYDRLHANQVMCLYCEQPVHKGDIVTTQGLEDWKSVQEQRILR
jgi:hypothetical protein